MDFVLKILHLKERGKVRVQLWDMAGGSMGQNSRMTLAPLFIRNAVGCVVVAKANKEDSITK